MWRTEFPDYKSLWAKTSPIQRADLARVMIVLKHGGLYADLDCIPTQSIAEILQANKFELATHHTVFCVEDVKTEAEMATSARWPLRKGAHGVDICAGCLSVADLIPKTGVAWQASPSTRSASPTTSFGPSQGR